MITNATVHVFSELQALIKQLQLYLSKHDMIKQNLKREIESEGEKKEFRLKLSV